MANYEVKFTSGTTARTKTLRRAADLSRGEPFIARKLLRGSRTTTWAKFQLIGGRIKCLARRGG